MSGVEQFNKTVTAMPEIQNEVAFDSEFIRSVRSDQNHTLKITLRFCFQQINPDQVQGQIMRSLAQHAGVTPPADGRNVGMHADYDRAVKFIKDWTSAEWLSFIGKVRAQAALWNNKFWLIPPDDFAYFDVTEGNWVNKSGKTVTRLNLKCEFELEITQYPPYAHRTIQVVNLIGTDFRSDDSHYDSEDPTPVNYSYADIRGTVVPTTQPTVAHEIGHAIGLPHIGVTRGLSQCQLAVMWGKNIHESSLPALYKGGEGSLACYGQFAGAGDINNIMGAGATFEPENARPWLDRIFLHLRLNQFEMGKALMSMSKWRVSLTPPCP
jgi:hypothetical protein